MTPLSTLVFALDGSLDASSTTDPRSLRAEPGADQTYPRQNNNIRRFQYMLLPQNPRDLRFNALQKLHYLSVQVRNVTPKNNSAYFSSAFDS